MSHCAALWCNNSRRTCQGKPFFRFPKDQERCMKWLRYTLRPELETKVLSHDRGHWVLCADHFTDDQFTNYTKKSLCWNAVPTMYPPGKMAKLLHIEELFEKVNGFSRAKQQDCAPLQDHALYVKINHEQLACDAAPACNPPISSAPDIIHVKIPPRNEVTSKGHVTIQTPSMKKALDWKNTESKLKTRLQDLRKRNALLRVKVSRLTKKLNRGNHNKKITVEDVISSAQEFLNEPTLAFLESQLENQGRSLSARRWTEGMKKFCLQLFLTSRKAYQLLSQTFALPGKGTVKKWLLQKALKNTDETKETA